MTRMVHCVKLDEELPGLEKPPFSGELGQRIYENVSQRAWEMWKAYQVIVINHYGLVLADPRARQFLIKELEKYFFAEEKKEMPEGWSPEEE